MRLTREVFERGWTGEDLDLRVFTHCFKVDFEEWWQSLREGWGEEPSLDVDSHVMVWEHPIGERFTICPDEENFHERQYIVFFTYEEREYDFIFKPRRGLYDEIDLYLFKGVLLPYTPKDPHVRTSKTGLNRELNPRVKPTILRPTSIRNSTSVSNPTPNSTLAPKPKPVPAEPSKDSPFAYGEYCEAIGNYEEAYTYYRKAARNREKIAVERLERAGFNRKDPLHGYAKGGWY